MNLKISFTSLLLLAFLGLNAQKVKYGQLWKADYVGESPRVIDEDDRNLYTLVNSYTQLNIETLDKRSVQSVVITEVDLKEEPVLKYFDFKINTTATIDNKFYVFVNVNNDVTHQGKLIALRLDPKTGQIQDSTELAAQPHFRDYRSMNYTVHVTPDKRKILVKLRFYNKREKTSIERLMLFDQNLGLQTSREFLNQGKEWQITSRIHLDNEGGVYFFRPNQIVFMDPYNDYEQYREGIPRDDLAVNGKLVNWAIGFNEKGNAILTAFYQTTDTEDQPDANLPERDRTAGDRQMEGLKYFEFDPLEREFVKSKLNLFTQDFKDLFRFDDDKLDKFDGEINHSYSHIDLLFKEDGTAYLIAQPRYRYNLKDTKGNITGTKINYGEIMLLSLNLDGALVWSERIPIRATYKTGSSADALVGALDYFGYFANVHNGNLHLFYNDDPENKAGEDQNLILERYKKVKNGQPVFQSLNLETGNRKAKAFAKLVKEKLYFKPGLMYYSDLDQKYYYYIVHKKKMQLCSLSFPRNRQNSQ